MGFINPKPPLRQEETVLWHQPLGWGEGQLRSPIAGTLYATTTDLLFVANRTNFPNPGHHDLSSKRIPIVAIARVGIEERAHTPYDGGMRRRVRLELRDGTIQLLVTNKPDRIAAQVQRLLDEHARGQPNSVPPPESAPE
jgi:hypothetical protein